jgi:hypothetical protein
MTSALSLSAAACRAAKSSTARKALSVLRKPICPFQLLLDEAVAVEVIAGLERKERGHPHDDGAEDLVADEEIVVGETAALRGKDPVVGVLGLPTRPR